LIGDVSATTTISRTGSALSLSRAELPERFAILLEVRRSKVEDVVLLQKGVHLHPCFESKEPAKLGGGDGLGPVRFKCQAFERGAGQVLPLGLHSLRYVFRQFQRYLHGNALPFII